MTVTDTGDGFFIDDDIREYMPNTDKLCDEDLEKAIIAENGARDALLVARLPDGKKILYDGHRRYGVCKKHGLEYFIQVKDVKDYNEIKRLMNEIQSVRRNLSFKQLAMVRGRLRLKPNESLTKATKRTAKETGVTERTLYRDREYAAAVDSLAPAIRDEVVQNWSKGGAVRLSKLDPVEQVDRVKKGEVIPSHGERKKPSAMLKGSFEERKAATEKFVVDVQNALADVDEAKPDLHSLREAKRHCRAINRLLDKWGAQDELRGTTSD